MRIKPEHSLFATLSEKGYRLWYCSIAGKYSECKTQGTNMQCLFYKLVMHTFLRKYVLQEGTLHYHATVWPSA